MTGRELLKARKFKRWNQATTASKLGVSQPYLSLLERDGRLVTEEIARRAVKLFDLSATALPLESDLENAGSIKEAALAVELANLGYPRFAHLRSGKPKRNPARVLLAALSARNLDSRIIEALPWLVLEFINLEWQRLIRAIKVNDLQNRLGFVISVARELAENSGDDERARVLTEREAELERSLLAREDTLCHDSLTEAEKRWLRDNGPAAAKRWRLLTDLSAEHLDYTV